MTKLKEEAFVGCVNHEVYDYYCLGCLSRTVGRLCELLDKKEAETAAEKKG